MTIVRGIFILKNGASNQKFLIWMVLKGSVGEVLRQIYKYIKMASMWSPICFWRTILKVKKLAAQPSPSLQCPTLPYSRLFQRWAKRWSWSGSEKRLVAEPAHHSFTSLPIFEIVGNKAVPIFEIVGNKAVHIFMVLTDGSQGTLHLLRAICERKQGGCFDHVLQEWLQTYDFRHGRQTF